MPKTRSPNFPSLDLGKAVELAGKLYKHAQRHLMPVEAIVKDKKRIIPCAAYCENEFRVAPGASGGGYFVGVPAILGTGGVEKIIEFSLEANEQKLMDESVQHVKDLVKIVREMFPELA